MKTLYPKAAYRLIINGKDLTPTLTRLGLLSSLTVTEKRGEEADTVSLVLIDDGSVPLPRRGQIISVALGWEGQDLVDKGQFKIDAAGHDGPPDVITVRASSADLTAALRVRRDKSWRDTTLGAVVQDLAARNGLQVRIAPELASKTVALVSQSRESDANLLTRLGRLYDAVATVKAGRLIFSPIGRGSTTSGQAIPTITIQRTAADTHSWSESDRETFAAVTASWHDVAAGARKTVKVGDANADSSKTQKLRRVFASEDAARQAAEAKLRRSKRGAADLRLALALGRPEIYPEQRIKAVGWKPEIDDAEWLIETATHHLEEGLSTALELQTG